MTRLFNDFEIEKLEDFVNKTKDENLTLTDEQSNAANAYLRKNISFYLNSHLVLHRKVRKLF